MKKGYQCPQCGNNDADALRTFSSRGVSISVLLAPQKLLSDPDSTIVCTDCGCRAEADIFRIRKISLMAENLVLP